CVLFSYCSGIQSSKAQFGIWELKWMMPWRWLNKPIADTHAEGSTANVAFGLPAMKRHSTPLKTLPQWMGFRALQIPA
ncbi:MAG: hypothetical protein AB2732_17235, partial [Candidatus Thiodiazotropha endolucinida]